MSQSAQHTQPRPASERQVSYLTSLISERDLASIGEDREILLDAVPSMGGTEASSWIDALLKLEKLPAEPLPTTEPDVPAGRYALIDARGASRFYIVDRPSKGKWAGRTFLAQQSGPNREPIKDRGHRLNVLGDIAKDVYGSLTLYGQLLGVCGACGLALTDETSRNRGIGPVCEKNRA